MGKLDGKVAIITGSTSGIGRETAYLFAKEGAKIVVTGRNEGRAKEVVDNIKANGGEAIYVIADTSNSDTPKKIFDATMEAYGTVDILMNNAGMINWTPLMQISIEDFTEVMTVDVVSVLHLTQLCAPVMKNKGKGSIINIGSVSGWKAHYGMVSYVTAKHAINGLTKSMAMELGPEIRANCICPGSIMTAMVEASGGEEACTPMVLASPLKRVGQSIEVATTALYLACDDSSFVTGQILRVDGGVDC